MFDCETTTDAAQQLRVAFFQVRNELELEREGCFYDPQSLTKAEIERTHRYATAHGIEVMTVEEC